MSEKYEEVRRIDAQGRRELHGSRHNHCFTSPVYREKVRIVNTKLAERYKGHPALAAGTSRTSTAAPATATTASPRSAPG